MGTFGSSNGPIINPLPVLMLLACFAPGYGTGDDTFTE